MDSPWTVMDSPWTVMDCPWTVMGSPWTVAYSCTLLNTPHGRHTATPPSFEFGPLWEIFLRSFGFAVFCPIVIQFRFMGCLGGWCGGARIVICLFWGPFYWFYVAFYNAKCNLCVWLWNAKHCFLIFIVKNIVFMMFSVTWAFGLSKTYDFAQNHSFYKQ